MKKKIAIFIDHDIIIRHFVNTKIFNILENDFNLTFFFPKNHKRVKIEIEKLGLKNFTKIPIDEKRAYKIRLFYHACNLRNLKDKVNRIDEEKNYKLILGRKLFFFYKYILRNDFIFKVFKIIKKKEIIRNLQLKNILKENQIDLIIHPTVLEGLFVYDLIDIGKELGIPTIYLMNSWDNPSTKALMGEAPDKLFVWGKQTEEHAIKYLKIPKSNIVISGAAQMQNYKSFSEKIKTEYKKLLKLKEDDKLLCYAGSSRGLNETAQLEILDKFIDNKKIKNIKLLYKPHPWKDFSNSGELNFFNYNFRNTLIDPYSVENYKLRSNGSERINVDLIDYEYTKKVLNSIDALFTPMSTIMLEATMMGIPTCVYYPIQEQEFSLGFRNDLGRKMFIEFFDIVNPILVKDKKNIIQGIENLINKLDNLDYKNNLKLNSKFFNKTMDLNYKEILLENVKKLAN